MNRIPGAARPEVHTKWSEGLGAQRSGTVGECAGLMGTLQWPGPAFCAAEGVPISPEWPLTGIACHHEDQMGVPIGAERREDKV